MTRCLLVDDDPAIRSLLIDYLARFGLQAEAVPDGAALRARLPQGGIDVLLLDLMLPDDDGLALCQWVKRQQPQLPVIMLTAQGDPLSRVLGLELGADDYLPKSFEPRELVARIKAVLRRGGPAAAEPMQLRFEGWRFDRRHHQRLRGDVAGRDLNRARPDRAPIIAAWSIRCMRFLAARRSCRRCAWASAARSARARPRWWKCCARPCASAGTWWW